MKAAHENYRIIHLHIIVQITRTNMNTYCNHTSHFGLISQIQKPANGKPMRQQFTTA